MNYRNGSEPSSALRRPLPHLCQIVALSVTYRGVLSLLGLGPIVVLLIPLLTKCAYAILDWLTLQHTPLALGLATFFTVASRNVIRQSAPSPKAVSDALAKVELSLPLVCFLLSLLVVRNLLKPLEDVVGLHPAFLAWSPTLSLAWALRLASGMLLLGIAVVARYIGYPSVVRCSSSPLLANPYAIGLWDFPKLVSTILNNLKTPSDRQGDLIRSKLGGWPIVNAADGTLPSTATTARRLQKPTMWAILVQVLLAAVIAVATAYTAVLPFFSRASHGGNSRYKAALILSTIAPILIHLWQTILNGVAHELNPHKYHLPYYSIQSTQQWWKAVLRPMLMNAVVVPIASIGASFLFADEPHGHENDAIGTIMGSCFSVVLLVALFLHVFDESLRTVLCRPPANMRRVISEVSDSSNMATYLEVAMYSVLHSNVELVSELCAAPKPPPSHSGVDELRRNDVAVESMAKTLLHKTSADESAAHLEEDLLRYSILESLGGTALPGTGLLSSGMDEKAATSHLLQIREWVDPEFLDRQSLGCEGGAIDNFRREPLVVPLVRALCAYIGGVGEALSICSKKPAPILASPWILPPGAIVCCECAIRGAARCIVWSLRTLARSFDWRSTHLSMLIPVFLASAHRLVYGIVKFSRTRNEGKPIDHLEQADLVRITSPELMSLFLACNEASVLILERLKALEGNRRIEFRLDTECQKWVDGLWLGILNRESLQVGSLFPSLPSTR